MGKINKKGFIKIVLALLTLIIYVIFKKTRKK